MADIYSFQNFFSSDCPARLHLDKCLTVARAMLQAGREQKNTVMELSATVSLGNTLFWMGKFDEAETLLLPWLQQNPDSVPEQNILDPLFIRMFSLLIAIEKDEKDKAASLTGQIEKMLGKSKNPFYQAVAYQALGWSSYVAGTFEKLDEYAKNLVKISWDHHFCFYLGIGKIFHGFCSTKKNFEEGILKIEQGYEILVDHCKMEPVAMNSIYGHIMGTTCLSARDFGRFVPCMEKVIGFARAHNETAYLDELCLLKAKYHQEVGEQELAQEHTALALRIADENGSVKTLRMIRAFSV